MGSALFHAREKTSHRAARGVFHQADLDRDPSLSEMVDTLAMGALIRVERCNNHTLRFRFCNQFSAGGAALAFVDTGFQGDVDVRTLGGFPCLLKRSGFGMGGDRRIGSNRDLLRFHF